MNAALVLHIFNSKGALWDRITGTEADLREQGVGFTTGYGQKTWTCELRRNNGVATCKGGVWTEVTP
jgi:hypothetical protein